MGHEIRIDIMDYIRRYLDTVDGKTPVEEVAVKSICIADSIRNNIAFSLHTRSYSGNVFIQFEKGETFIRVCTKKEIKKEHLDEIYRHIEDAFARIDEIIEEQP